LGNAKQIQNSSLNCQKELLQILGLRFINNKVKITKHGDELFELGKINNNKLAILEGEAAEIESDYDFTIRCKIKYKKIKKIVDSGEFSIPKIEAFLNYYKDGKSLTFDLSQHFNDYYTVYETLIPSDYVFGICKLWDFNNCRLDSINGNIDGKKFYYKNLKFKSDEIVDFMIF
jgi:hypothetical protein